MLRFRHRTLIVLSGFIWLGMGIFLLNLGLNLIVNVAQSAMEADSHHLMTFAASVAGGLNEGAIILIAVGLVLGYFKGRYALGKSVQRGVNHIRSLPQPSPLKSLYSWKYYLLIALMIGLGMLLRFLQVPEEIRGAVLVIVGSALINGAILYFRQGLLTGNA
jgi:hypothetical protein